MPHPITPAEQPDKGRHYTFIKDAISEPFKKASLNRGRALAASELAIEPWYTTAPSSHHDTLKTANLAAWHSQNQVDEQLKALQDVYSFAAPLLQQKLKDQYGVEEDVKTTWLQLYMPKKLPWYAADILPASTSRTVSLLDAALHNFASTEETEADSDYITQPDARGHFDVLPIKSKMSIKQFQLLCRELDIGAQYKKHLDQHLLPAEPVAKAALEQKVVTSQKDALRVAAQLALSTGDIQYDAYKLVLALSNDHAERKLDGQKMGCGGLSMLGTALNGIALIAPMTTDSRGIGRIVVYVPHDPDHPLKEYPSPDAFMTELARQLRDDKVGASTQQSYRQFFSQFVDHQQRGHFFADLEDRLFETKHHTKDDPADQRPAWRKEPRPRPNLQFERSAVPADYWAHTYRQTLNKILNDARVIAVSTADTDSNERWAWWDNFKKIISDIFNVALFIATPFVPGLGELMMAYTVYQLTTDVVEGLVDLAEGLGQEAAEHVISVVTDVIQLVAFKAGTDIGKFLRVKASRLIDGMKPVTLADGKKTLWHPDSTPYQQQKTKVARDAKPDAAGLYLHEGKQFLHAQGEHFELMADEKTGKMRVRHPFRDNAYQPEVTLNGAGAYVLEGEQPRLWDDATLLRRIGPSVAQLTDVQLETALKISGTDPAELRGMYVGNQRPPTLLTDTIKRLDIDQDIRLFINRMKSNDPLEYGKADSVTQLQVLTAHGMWPETASMKIIDASHKTIWEYTGTQAPRGRKLVVQVEERQLIKGQLLEIVMETLDEHSATIILDLPTDTLPVSLETRTRALRKRIADVTANERAKLFAEYYSSREVSDESLLPLISRTFPDIPAQGVENLLAKATKAERDIMVAEDRIPLRLKYIARQLQMEARSARAYEGFFRSSLATTDTERLTLNSLRLYSDALGDVRIEIRMDNFDGKPTCQAGPEDAVTVRILLRGENNRYVVCDAAGNKLHEASDLFQAVLQALPDQRLKALGYRVSDREKFKEWVMSKTGQPAERRTLIDERGRVPVPERENLLLLRGPRLSTLPLTLETRVEDLYPHFSEREVRTFVDSLSTRADPVATLKGLETELDDLRTLLDEWRWKQPDYPVSHPRNFVTSGGQHIAEQLNECFKRKARFLDKRSARVDEGYALDLSSDFSPTSLQWWWKKLPPLGKYLEQITALNLDNTRFGHDSNGLLKDFRQLRHLTARRCNLTQLPEGIARMHLLETLNLGQNKIQLNASDVNGLRDLTRIESLRLDDNPLGISLNVERMPRLKVLSLNNTGINEWPSGLLSKKRPRGFFLDMQANPISRVPQVTPASDQALLVARTRLDVGKLSQADAIAYRGYRESVGIAADYYYSALADQDVAAWPLSDRTIWGTSESGRGAFRLEAWHDLATEPDSLGFFMVIKKQLTSADYLQGGTARSQLTDRVWRMIDAAYLDPKTRKELFTESSAPTTCANAGAQMFNNLGIKVLASEAYSYSTSAAELDGKLVKLAKGAARLEQINEIARADIASRSGTPDEVEVHLAYETGLAERLDLPWQSEGRRWPSVAGVDASAIDEAYKTVSSLEEGDGLVNQMLDQLFWMDYLRDTHPEEFRNNALTYEGKSDLLEQLRLTQKTWSEAKGLPEERQTALREKAAALALQLKVPDDEVFTGQPMADSVYERVYAEIGDEEQELARQLTRTSLANAGL